MWKPLAPKQKQGNTAFRNPAFFLFNVRQRIMFCYFMNYVFGSFDDQKFKLYLFPSFLHFVAQLSLCQILPKFIADIITA